MKSAVIVFPGSNCDRDLAVAFEAATGSKPTMVWHRDTELPDDIEPAFGGDLLAALGHQADVLGARALDDAQHLVGHGSFEVQWHADGGLQARDVVVADVAAVFTQVEGDDVGTALDGQQRRLHRIVSLHALQVVIVRQRRRDVVGVSLVLGVLLGRGGVPQHGVHGRRPIRRPRRHLVRTGTVGRLAPP